MIGRHGYPAFNENGRDLLQLCCSNGNGLCIMNTIFQHTDVHKYALYRPSTTYFYIVSSDLFSEELEVRVKRRA